MFGSIKVATIRGIPIRLHVTLWAMFALLIVRFGLMGVPAGVLLFGSVLLHELGHSVVAQRYKIPIASIDLHLLGGMALMTRPPETARQEMLIAAAGPVVSMVLGGLFFLAADMAGGSLAFVEPRFPDLLVYAASMNVLMAVFNLIPALPMDGGRIFRAALSSRMGALRATRVAGIVSRCFAVVFLLGGLYLTAWPLMAIGGLLFFMVSNEERVVQAQEAIRARAVALDGIDLGAHPAPSGEGPVFDQDGNQIRETREEFVDPYGRRYVVITRLAQS